MKNRMNVRNLISELIKHDLDALVTFSVELPESEDETERRFAEDGWQFVSGNGHVKHGINNETVVTIGVLCGPSNLAVEPKSDALLEKARILRTVYRLLNSGHCPACQLKHHFAEILRGAEFLSDLPALVCPSCKFYITHDEIRSIEEMFYPEVDPEMQVFEDWRKSRNQ